MVKLEKIGKRVKEKHVNYKISKIIINNIFILCFYYIGLLLSYLFSSNEGYEPL